MKDLLSCGSCDAEAVVRILQVRRNTRTGRTARDLDVVSPRTASGRTPLPVFGAARISLRRFGIIIRRKPIAAPFVNVVAQVVKPVWIRLIASHRFRPRLPPEGIVRQLFRRRVSPWK